MREAEIEKVVGAFRERRHDGDIAFHPSWYDLDSGDRRLAFEQGCLQRSIEAALDPDGLSQTARAVLARIPGANPE